MHGYIPEAPEMRSAFFIVGPGVTPGLSLDVIDMRDIAPTLAGLLNLRLRDADSAPLALNAPYATAVQQVAQVNPGL